MSDCRRDVRPLRGRKSVLGRNVVEGIPREIRSQRSGLEERLVVHIPHIYNIPSGRECKDSSVSHEPGSIRASIFARANVSPADDAAIGYTATPQKK